MTGDDEENEDNGGDEESFDKQDFSTDSLEKSVVADTPDVDPRGGESDDSESGENGEGNNGDESDEENDD